MRSIPFSFWSNRGLQECSSEAAAPQICIMQNRNSVHFGVVWICTNHHAFRI